MIVLVRLVPCTTLTLLGEAERVKSPTGFTVTVNVVLPVKLPEVPVTVAVKVPIVAAVVAERIKALVVVAGFIPKPALTPLGRPDAVKFTEPLNPFKGLIVMAIEPLLPWRNVRLPGDAERMKLG